jgi:hypothetical protein
MTVTLSSRLFEKRCKFAALLHTGCRTGGFVLNLQRFSKRRHIGVTVVSGHGIGAGPALEETLPLCCSASSCRSDDMKKSLLAYAERFYVLYTIGTGKKILRTSSVRSLKQYLSFDTNFDPC